MEREIINLIKRVRPISAPSTSLAYMTTVNIKPREASHVRQTNKSKQAYSWTSRMANSYGMNLNSKSTPRNLKSYMSTHTLQYQQLNQEW
jgi:predicted DsbA family dithiol-disulfide isomerase